jgi:hypothetical protein
MTPGTLCLLLRPHGLRGKFDAYLGDALICTSRQPLLDGARELLRRGCDPASLLTTRHEKKAYDNFVPKPISDLAGWHAVDSPQGVHFRRHAPCGSTTALPMRVEVGVATTLPDNHNANPSASLSAEAA